ncbi:MAG: recombination mediator RecR [Patescibacteria group bacterium]|nr:recombination mediator RecR [Patescibacteria group bacterium]
MNLPKAIRNLAEAFERLPGIGPKTATRLSYYLLQAPETEAKKFAQALEELKENTKICSVCRNIDEADPCSICTDSSRDTSVICVVERPTDILALEKSGKYRGLYHVLGGVISPLNSIGPEELYIDGLVERLASSVKRREEENPKSLNANRYPLIAVREVVLATNASLEGEATAMYLSKLLKSAYPNLRVTRIGRGLPVGADLEYADDVTLTRAMEGRQEY